MNSSKSMGERPAEGERLSKRIMQLRDCSRREAEQYIEAGFVRVDGVVVQEPQFRVTTQNVALDAHASLLNLMSVTLILNKPAGWTDGLEPLPTQKPVARSVAAGKLMHQLAYLEARKTFAACSRLSSTASTTTAVCAF